MIELNDEQEKAVKHKDGPLLVAAVAGSGKTRVLTSRVVYLVQHHNVDPSKILAVTFTRKAADEMEKRILENLGGLGVQVRTFHSLALQICKEESDMQGWELQTKNSKFVKLAVGFKELDWKGADISVLCAFISRCKERLLSPDECADLAEEWTEIHRGDATPGLLQEVYRVAERLRVAGPKHYYGFDDMLYGAGRMLRDYQHIRERWSAKWDYVLQDEAQDQNYAQLMIGELLAKRHRNYMLVGDPAQTIYEWRGAEPSKLLSFPARWGAKTITMHRNYRCADRIVEAANGVLSTIPKEKRLDTFMKGERGVPGYAAIHEYDDPDHEGVEVVKKICRLLEGGRRPEEIAILYRLGRQSRAPEEALIQNGVPHHVLRGSCFFERKEVRVLLDYLRLAEGRGGVEEMLRTLKSPFRWLSASFLSEVASVCKLAERGLTPDLIINWAGVVETVVLRPKTTRNQKRGMEEWLSVVQWIQGAIAEGKDVHAILRHITRTMEYERWLKASEGEPSIDNNKEGAVKELISTSGRFESVTALLDYAEYAAKSRRDDEYGVTLGTIHSVKGLEWPVVFLIGVCNSILPHFYARYDDSEERRVFYVGVTRAKDVLMVSYFDQIEWRGECVPAGPSHFLEEAGLLGSLEYFPGERELS